MFSAINLALHLCTWSGLSGHFSAKVRRNSRFSLLLDCTFAVGRASGTIFLQRFGPRAPAAASLRSGTPFGLSLPRRFARGPLPLTEPRAATPSGGLPPFGAGVPLVLTSCMYYSLPFRTFAPGRASGPVFLQRFGGILAFRCFRAAPLHLEGLLGPIFCKGSARFRLSRL